MLKRYRVIMNDDTSTEWYFCTQRGAFNFAFEGAKDINSEIVEIAKPDGKEHYQMKIEAGYLEILKRDWRKPNKWDHVQKVFGRR